MRYLLFQPCRSQWKLLTSRIPLLGVLFHSHLWPSQRWQSSELVGLRVPQRGKVRAVDGICPSHWTLPSAVELRATLDGGAGEGSALLSSPHLPQTHMLVHPGPSISCPLY